MSQESIWNKRVSNIPSALANNTKLVISKAEGSILYDIDGKQYIDFASGIGSMNIGHNHPVVVAAIKNQSQKYIQPCFHLMIHQPYVELAEKLNKITPGNFSKQTMLCNSGAEAIENAIKVARFATKKTAIICFDGAFHGRTYMSMSLTSKKNPYKHGFGPLASNIYRINYPAYDTTHNQFASNWKKLITSKVNLDDIAAIIIEPQLGEGGFIPANKDIMIKIRKLCDKHNIVLIIDEIQTGFCRTGKMFAIEHFNISPDIIVMGKSLASGLPLSAITARKDLFKSLPTGSLGGTNSGNPINCAAALASIQICDNENLAIRANIIGEKMRRFFIKQRLTNNFIGKITGLGAMVGVEFINSDGSANPEVLKNIVGNSLRNGLLLITCGKHKNILRNMMALNISDNNLTSALEIIEKSIRNVAEDLNATYIK